MQARPIRIPTVSNDTDWDFCFHLSEQTRIPAHQQTDELCSTCESGESEEDTTVQEGEKAIDHMSLPREKLAQSQKKITHLIKEKMNIQANKELIRCVILSQIIFGEQHWKCAQALANLAYGYLTLRGLPAQAKKHAESAKNILLTWKGNLTSDEEKKEILEVLVILYYTLGVAWLLQNHGKEAYFHLQRADRNMKELKELNKGSDCGVQISEKDLTIALGSLPQSHISTVLLLMLSGTPQPAPHCCCVSMGLEASGIHLLLVLPAQPVLPMIKTTKGNK